MRLRGLVARDSASVAKQLAVVELDDDGTVRVRVEGRVRELTALVREAEVEAVAQALGTALPDGGEVGPELPADEWRARGLMPTSCVPWATSRGTRS